MASVFPNSWAHWTATTGAAWAATEVHTPAGNQTWCSLAEHGCPEYAKWSPFFLTTSLQLSTNVWAKLYPDVRMFYGAFYVATALGMACTHTPRLRRALHARWRLPRPLAAIVPRGLCEHGVISAGTLVVYSGLAVLLSLFLVYWWGAHD
eukprot:5143102-Prymnesium_polylepis.2